MAEERSKAAGAAIVGGGLGLAAGLGIGARRPVRAVPNNKLEAILDDTFEIKTTIGNLSNVLLQLINVLAPRPVAFPDFPPYNVRKFELDTAKTKDDPQEVNLPGDALTFHTDGTLDGIWFAMDSPTNDWIPIGEFGNPYAYPAIFQRFYLSWSAQASKYLRVHIGREAGAAAAVEITAAAPKQIFYTIVSDKDTHFTSSIAQNAKEDENIPGFLGNKIRIVGLVILSDQQLHYRVIFWRKDTFDDTDLDVDSFISSQELDLSLDGWQIGATGQWYLAITSLNIDYEDEDTTNELHISLQNLSATAKNAGATGEVVLGVIYEMRA